MPFLSQVPPNQSALVTVDQAHHRFQLVYNGKPLLTARFQNVTRVEVVPTGDPDRIEQSFVFHGSDVQVDGTIFGESEAFAAETSGIWPRRFPEVRNSDGPSHNLRNNAVYDRGRDLFIGGPSDGSTMIVPEGNGQFHLYLSGSNLKLVFRPHYYQRYKNLPFFEPWKSPVTRRPVSGWCSWWAYRGDIDQPTMERAADVFSRRLKNFGYDIVQLDDGYEGGEGAPPNYWLHTNSKFPGGLPAVAKAIRKKGLQPGVWLSAQMTDDAFAKSHPAWFVKDANGQPHKGPWIGYGVDASNTRAMKSLYGPIYDEFKTSGFSYVKLDTLRHLLYDSLYPSKPQVQAEGTTPEAVLRDYLGFARSRLGAETYILACWGVLPEAAGIADACRLGGDGFGPSTMQQYNSWNNVVWRNDPDHVDLQGGGEEIIRPTLVSMAGAQLLLSDKLDFYENEENLEGAKRASPVPFTLPGQLYDFDPSKTDNLIRGLRNRDGGTNAGPIDADQNGKECPWWQMDLSRSFENWTVLARLSWKDQPEQMVSFADLGLAQGRYAVYEFWSKKYLGEFDDQFPAEAQSAKVAHVYSIRKVQDHPQVVSTSRHITQGGPDLDALVWRPHAKLLEGISRPAAKDPYEVRIRCAGRIPISSNRPMKVEGDLLRLNWTQRSAAPEVWWVKFR